MKLFGGSKKSKHAGGYAHHTRDGAPAKETAGARPAPARRDDTEEYDDRFLPTWAKVIIVVVTVLIILVAGAFIWFKVASRPPVQTGELNNVGENQSRTARRTTGKATPKTTAKARRMGKTTVRRSSQRPAGTRRCTPSSSPERTRWAPTPTP